MADRGIQFSAAMVRALLAGTKTQTRRLAPQPPAECSINYMLGNESWLPVDQRSPIRRSFEAWSGPLFDAKPKKALCGSFEIVPRIQPGDVLHPLLHIPSLNRDYAADTFGNIWSRAKKGRDWTPLKPGRSSREYLTVTPAHEGRYRTRAVHRLVAEAFYGDQSATYPMVRHLNGSQSDNSPENLDWGTVEDNWTDRIAHGNAGGEDHHHAKLTQEAVEEIRSSASSQRALAKRFGVAQSTIWAVKSNRLWVQGAQANKPNFARWASRLTLIVTDVRVQRLQDISEEDAIAEGAYRGKASGRIATNHTAMIMGDYYATARGWYRDLWNSLHTDPGTRWDDNPWITAISFTVKHGNIDQIGGEA